MAKRKRIDCLASQANRPGREKAWAAIHCGRNRRISRSKLGARIKLLQREVHRMVTGSATPEAVDFDADHWLAQWLERPLPALAGRTPLNVVNTPEGFKVVLQVLAAMESGAYL